MSKLTFAAISGRLECIDSEGSGRNLTLILPTDTAGAISIGGIYCESKGGRARLDTMPLSDGEYPIILHREGKSEVLDTVELRGRELRQIITKNKYYTLLKRTHTLTEENEKIKKRLLDIESKIFDNVIF